MGLLILWNNWLLTLYTELKVILGASSSKGLDHLLLPPCVSRVPSSPQMDFKVHLLLE